MVYFDIVSSMEIGVGSLYGASRFRVTFRA